MAPMSRFIAMLLLLGAASGCGEDEAPRGAPICNGVEELRLRAFLGGGGQGGPLRTEHGYQSLVIDGLCRYWMNEGVRDSQTAATIYMRDAIPYEKADGQLPF